jgi:hypothetical protein
VRGKANLIFRIMDEISNEEEVSILLGFESLSRSFFFVRVAYS